MRRCTRRRCGGGFEVGWSCLIARSRERGGLLFHFGYLASALGCLFHVIDLASAAGGTRPCAQPWRSAQAPTPLRCSVRGRAAELAPFTLFIALKQLRRVRCTKRATRADLDPALLAATDSLPSGRRLPRKRGSRTSGEWWKCHPSERGISILRSLEYISLSAGVARRAVSHTAGSAQGTPTAVRTPPVRSASKACARSATRSPRGNASTRRWRTRLRTMRSRVRAALRASGA